MYSRAALEKSLQAHLVLRPLVLGTQEREISDLQGKIIDLIKSHLDALDEIEQLQGELEEAREYSGCTGDSGC
jgi:hypothetical protein